MSQTTVATISLDDLRNELKEGKVEHFWNVLTDEYYKGESIAGSRRVPVERVGREVSEASIPSSARIVVYCASPTCPLSFQAAEKLATLGYTNAVAFEGGIEEWKAAGLELA